MSTFSNLLEMAGEASAAQYLQQNYRKCNEQCVRYRQPAEDFAGLCLSRGSLPECADEAADERDGKHKRKDFQAEREEVRQEAASRSGRVEYKGSAHGEKDAR